MQERIYKFISMENEQIYTIDQVADKLKVSERYIRDNINRKELKAFKRGKRMYILHSDLVEWIRNGKEVD